VLCNFLGEVESRLTQTPGDARLLSRVHCFLVAQGYRAVRTAGGVRGMLRHFITRAHAWTTDEAIRRTSPEAGNSYDDESMRKVIANLMSDHVTNPGLLFS
jgi:hypothetical protein